MSIVTRIAAKGDGQTQDGRFVALTARCWYEIPLLDALETTGLLLPKQTPLAPASKRAKKGGSKGNGSANNIHQPVTHEF